MKKVKENKSIPSKDRSSSGQQLTKNKGPERKIDPKDKRRSHSADQFNYQEEFAEPGGGPIKRPAEKNRR